MYEAGRGQTIRDQVNAFNARMWATSVFPADYFYLHCERSGAWQGVCGPVKVCLGLTQPLSELIKAFSPGIIQSISYQFSTWLKISLFSQINSTHKLSRSQRGQDRAILVAIGFRQGSVHYFNERIDVKLESQWHDPIDLKFFMKHLNENLNENENAFKFSNAITNFKGAT